MPELTEGVAAQFHDIGDVFFEREHSINGNTDFFAYVKVLTVSYIVSYDFFFCTTMDVLYGH